LPFAPHLAPGQDSHLPHEAWHVVQQRQGRVQPNLEVSGTPVNDNPGLEHEADVMGAKALQRARAPARRAEEPCGFACPSGAFFVPV
jgi:hypothetical protein